MMLAAAHDALAMARTTGLAVDPVTIRERTANEDEWRDIWKQFFRATRIGRRFTVRPSWDPGQPVAGEFIIDLDPGRAFGTGAHPSTRLAIALAEDLCDKRPSLERFLDLGCGSGILSIAASRLWPDAAGLAIDNDAEATSCSEENFARNAVRNVTILTGTLDEAGATYDVILANIQADVLGPIAGPLASKLAPSGHLILSGILVEQVDELVAVFAQVGFRLATRHDEGEWSGLMMSKATATTA